MGPSGVGTNGRAVDGQRVRSPIASAEAHAPYDRYGRLLEAAADYLFTVHVHRGVPVRTVHQSGCAAVTGYRPEEFNADPLLWIRMVPEEDRPWVRKQVAAILAGHQVMPLEHRIVHKDGRVRWVSNISIPCFNADGHLVAYDGLIRDVTGRRETEQALRDTRRGFLAAFDNGLVGMAQMRADGRLLRVNQKLCEIVGYDAPELLKRGFQEITHPDDLPFNLHCMRRLQAGEVVQCAFEKRYLHKRGTTVWAYVTLSLLELDADEPAGYVAAIEDISSRKRVEQSLRDTERQLQAIVNTAADAIVTVDRQGTIGSFNPAAERMFGCSRDQAIGQNVSLLMPHADLQTCDADLTGDWASLDPERIGSRRELLARRRDGSTFPAELTVGRVDGTWFTGIIRDITERKRLQSEVLRIAESEQRRIGQELHDDIQQQLYGLSIMAQHLAEQLQTHAARAADGDGAAGADGNGAAAADGRPELAELQRVAARVARGIGAANRQIHLLSHDLVPVEIDGQGLRAALAQLAADAAEQHQVDCCLECDQSVELADAFSATHLYRIAQEAVTNALKHSHPRQIAIRLQQSQQHLELAVIDDGVGMDRAFADRCGGKGLKIMAYRASVIGASLQVQTSRGTGTCVLCRLVV